MIPAEALAAAMQANLDRSIVISREPIDQLRGRGGQARERAGRRVLWVRGPSALVGHNCDKNVG
jgi:hypothetical protein